MIRLTNKGLFTCLLLLMLAFGASAFGTVEGVRVTTPDTCWYTGNFMTFPVSIEWTTWSQFPNDAHDPDRHLNYHCNNAEYWVHPSHDIYWTTSKRCSLLVAPNDEMCSFEMRLRFNDNVAQVATVSNSPLLDDDWNWGDVYYEVDNGSGEIYVAVAAANCQDLTRLDDPTELIHIGFYVDGGTGDDVDLEIVSFQYNEVSPYYVFFDDQEYYSDWNPDHPGTELIYTDNKSIGDFLVCRDLYVAGAIKYMSNGSPVCGAEVTLAYKADPDAVDPPAIDDITVETTCNMPCQEDCRGSYFIPDVTSEYNYCVGAWKDDEDDYERAITAFDASLILRDAVGQFHLDNYYQEVASDVSGDCTVSAYDASLILQWLVGDFDYFPKNEADETNWIFVALDHDPEHLCPVEEYCDQLTSSEHWDFGAMILGDVSGNWSLSDEELPKVTGGFVNEYVEIRPVRGSAAGVQEYDLVAKSAEAFSSQFVVKVLDGSAERVSVTAGSKDWFHASRAEGSTVRVATAGPRASADGVIARIVVDGSAEFVVEQLIINEAALVGSVSSDGLVQLPTSFALGNNYPNPFNPSTTIDYTLPATGTVELSVFNVLGERVKTLASGVHEAGVHQVEWDGTNSAGQAVSSGIYFYRLSGTNVSQTKKMMLLK